MPITVHILPTSKMVRPLSINQKDKETESENIVALNTPVKSTRWKVSKC